METHERRLEEAVEAKVEMEMVQCLVCDKELKTECGTDVVYHGVALTPSHGYGSKYDRCGYDSCLMGKDTDNLSRADQICLADKIKAFLCDDCYEKKIDKFKMWYVTERRPIVKEIE